MSKQFNAFAMAQQQFDAVADLAERKEVYTRDAAYMIAIERVANACRLRGWA